MPDLAWAILLIGAFTYLFYRFVRKVDEHDRADAWRRNHARKKRWYE